MNSATMFGWKISVSSGFLVYRLLHAANRTLHHAPITPHPALRTLHSAIRTQHLALHTQHSAPRTPHLTPCTPHHVPLWYFFLKLLMETCRNTNLLLYSILKAYLHLSRQKFTWTPARLVNQDRIQVLRYLLHDKSFAFNRKRLIQMCQRGGNFLHCGTRPSVRACKDRLRMSGNA